MKDINLKESLSALLDGQAGELEFRRVLNHLDDHPELKETWSHYALTSTLIKEGESGFEHVDLTKGIQQAIANEAFESSLGLSETENHTPGLNETGSIDTMTQDESESLTSLEQGLDGKGSNPSHKIHFGWMKQFAVAASVALVAVFGIREFSLNDQSAGLEGNIANVAPLILNDQPLGNSLGSPLGAQIGDRVVSQPVAANIDSNSALQNASIDPQSLAEAQRKLSEYLIQHAENAAMNSGNGMLNFARVVSYQPQDDSTTQTEVTVVQTDSKLESKAAELGKQSESDDISKQQ